MADEQKAYKRALKRTEDAVANFDKARDHFAVKRGYRDLEYAIRALHAAKLALVRGTNPEEPESKTKTLSDLNSKLFK